MASIIAASTTDELLTQLGEEYAEWAVTIDKEGYDLAKLKATSVENLVADIGLPNSIATGIYEALHKPSIDTSGPGIIVFYRALRAIDDEVAQGVCDIFTSAIIENGPERDGFKNSIETIEDDNLKNFALTIYDLMIMAAMTLDGMEAAKEYCRELMSSFKECLKETDEEKFKVAFSSGFKLETLDRVVIEKKPVASNSSNEFGGGSYYLELFTIGSRVDYFMVGKSTAIDKLESVDDEILDQSLVDRWNGYKNDGNEDIDALLAETEELLKSNPFSDLGEDVEAKVREALKSGKSFLDQLEEEERNLEDDDKDDDKDDDEDVTPSYRRASGAYEDDDEDVTYRRASTGRASTTVDDDGCDY